MTTTNFVDQQTVIEADWLNDVDDLVYPSTTKTTPADSDRFHIKDSAASYIAKIFTWSSLKTALWNVFGTLIAAGTAKTTPVSADTFALCDSAASNATKKVTLGNLQSALLPSGTYTPTLTGISNVTTITTLASSVWNYFRIGDFVTVSGGFTVTPTATSTPTEFTATLPIASTLSTCYLNGSGAMGEASVTSNQAIYISEYGVPGTTADFSIRSLSSAGADNGRFIFTYRVA